MTDTYERILRAIPATHLRDVQVVLLWLTFNAHPLTLLEMAEALMIDLDAETGSKIDSSRRPFSLQAIQAMCSSLVTLDGDGKTHI